MGLGVIRIRILAVVLFGSLVAAGSAPASMIVGGAGNDTLRGTQKADKLYGKAGNDKLFGFRGNDVLFGGAGADRLVCGPGRDIAWADSKDHVAKDCEIVKGLKPPPAPPVALGTYCGSTSQGMPLCFVVGSQAASPVRTIGTTSLAVQAECEPARQLDRSFEVLTLYVNVKSDRSFTARTVLAGYVSTFEGKFDESGTSATGSLSVQFVDELDGVHYECDSGVASWSARTPPPDVSAQPGTFCGLTEQGLDLCLDVVDSPSAVTNLKLLVRVECLPAATFAVSSAIPTKYAIREDGGFSFHRRPGSKTTGGGSFTVDQVMDGTFDASGASVTGTLSAHVRYDAPDGSHYECDSGSIGWSAQRR